MTALEQYIREKRKSGPLYMPYLTVGDPDFDSTVRFACAMIEEGADLIELGIPFSDPTADGPVIEAAMVRAMARPDFSLERVFSVAAEIHRIHPEVALVYLSYMNPVFSGFSGGVTEFVRRSAECGVRGIVIPDLPVDQPEAADFKKAGETFGVCQIFLSAPNTDPERLKALRSGGGFIYHVTSYGVTGERKELPPEVSAQIERVRTATGLPVFAGFGFSTPAQAASVRHAADGVIVGSLHHRLIQEKGPAAIDDLRAVTRGFVQALRPVS
jgi:tryptophan synthase alpha chain